MKKVFNILETALRKFDEYSDARWFGTSFHGPAIEKFVVTFWKGDGFRKDRFSIADPTSEKPFSAHGATLEEALRNFAEKVRNNPASSHVSEA